MITPYDDNYFMKKDLQEAYLAAEEGEVPVGAVILCDGRIIAHDKLLEYGDRHSLRDAAADPF